jgi:ABC-type transport system substrate-binding protein/class 3 adenylate cyclase/streptogramin lyase
VTEPRDPAEAETETSTSEASPPASPQTELRTFLIADIRGYTTYTREHGDEAGAALATRFAELVAEVVTAREGYLLELRGDEALVVFVSARKALRAALDLQARFTEDKLPRGVGIGLDAGEAIPVGNGYRGTALNLAARLCAKAGPGETLASETVIHLAAKVEGIAYVDARDLRLKGYTDAVRVVGVVPTDQAKGHRLAGSRRWSRLRRNQPLALAGASIVVVAIVATALWAGVLSGKPVSTAQPDPLLGATLPVLAFYDASTGQLVATTHFASPRNIAFFGNGSFWILGENPKALNRVDPVSHQVVQSIPVPVVEASGFNIDEDYLWLTDLAAPHVIRIEQRTGVVSTFSFGKDADDTAETEDVAVGAGSVWLSRPEVPEIVRLNRVTGKVQARLDVNAWGVSFGDGGLWYWREGQIGRIDPVTNEFAFDEIELSSDSWVGNIHIGGGDAWTAATSTGVVYRVDRNGRHTSFTLDPGVGEMAATSRTMWVTNADTGRLTGIDLVTGQPDRVIDPGHATLAVVASGDQLMIAVGPTFEEAVAGLSGSVLTVATNGVPWWDPDAPDPPLTDTWQVKQTLYLTCAGLLTYPDEAGAGGLALVREVAARMPAVSADGRTYKFTIRPGFQFSPPTNEPVTAETFRYTIERALSPLFDDFAPGPRTFGDIVGARAYREGRADHVTGLTATGDQLTITLEAPAPDILDRLASSPACPVPINTPAVGSGLNPDPPVAGAGPYYLAQVVPKRFVILQKNPNYHGARPQPFDAIAIRMKTAPATAIAMVENGEIDAAMFDGGDPLTSPLSALAAEWGPGSAQAASGDQRWFGGPRQGVDFIALNPSSPAFRSRDVRRAVSLAIDRSALSRIWVNGPTAELMVPSVRGSDDAASVPPRDLEAARALMKGRKLNVTMMGYPIEWGCDPCHGFELALTRQLKAIGITVSVRHPDDYPADALQPGSGVDLLNWGTGSDNPDPVAFISGLRDDAWLGEANLRQLARLDMLTGQARIDATVAFVHQIVDEQALVIPYDYPVYPFFISERIGCGFVQPAIGAVDLLSLCVKQAGP